MATKVRKAHGVAVVVAAAVLVAGCGSSSSRPASKPAPKVAPVAQAAAPCTADAMTATILASQASAPAITVTRVGCADGYGEALVRSTVNAARNIAVLRDVTGKWDVVAFGPNAATSAAGVQPNVLADLRRVVGPAPAEVTSTTTVPTSAAPTTVSPGTTANPPCTKTISNCPPAEIAEACSEFAAVNGPAKQKAADASASLAGVQHADNNGTHPYDWLEPGQISPSAELADQAARANNRYTKIDSDFGGLVDVLTPGTGATHADMANFYNAVVTDCGG